MKKGFFTLIVMITMCMTAWALPSANSSSTSTINKNKKTPTNKKSVKLNKPRHSIAPKVTHISAATKVKSVKPKITKNHRKIAVKQAITKTIIKTRHPVVTIKTQPAAKTKVIVVNKANLSTTWLPGYLMNNTEKNVTEFVRNTISTIKYTAYKMGGRKIDTNKGIYVVDCSRYVDHILKNTYPKAFSSLANWSGNDTPTTRDYYHYFMNEAEDSEDWNTIEDVEELRPGDILVFRNKNHSRNHANGHIMIVMDKPIKDGNTFLVRIADSAPVGHTKDTRMPHVSGIGIGTMLLKVNPFTLKPYAYSWKVGSQWKNNVKFAMARPRFATVESD